MAAVGVRSTNIDPATLVDEVIANQTIDGIVKTVRQPVAALGAQIAQGASAIVAKQVKATFAQLDAIKGTMAEGDVGLVVFDATVGLRGSYAKEGGALVRKDDLPETVAALASEVAIDARDEALVHLTGTVVARDVTFTARDVTLAARDAGVAAAQASGPAVFYDTKALATAAVAGLPADQVVEVFVDEDHNGKRTRYRKEGGALAFKLVLEPLYDKSVTIAKVADETQIVLASPDPLKSPAIFFGFDGNPGGADWESNTYADYIAGIDALFAAELLSGDVVKTDRGACSDGVKHLVSYSAGSGPKRMFIVAGLHGVERISAYAAMRKFQAFVQSDHPSMVLRRSQCTYTLLPVANPWAWDEYARINFNGVDPNRNFNFYFDRYFSADPLRYKGTAAFSEPETAAIKAIVDEGQDCFISCHNMGADERPYTMVVQAPSNFVTGKRNLCFSAAEIWKRKNPGSTFLRMEASGMDENPSEVSWFNLYNTWILGNSSCAAVLLECNSNLAGSDSLEMTDEAAHLYCSHMDTFETHWLSHGQAAPEPVALVFTAGKDQLADGVAISAGGTLLNDTTVQVVTFNFFGPGGAVPHDYLEVMFPEPGNFVFEATGYFEGGPTKTNINAQLEFSTAPNINTYSPDNLSTNRVVCPVGPDASGTFVTRARKNLSTLSADNRMRVRLRLSATVNASGAKLRRVVLTATFTPNHELVPAPAINGI